jgi:hypothetical protein
VRKAATRRVTAAVASGLQVVKRMRVHMRGTVLGSTPVQKRADERADEEAAVLRGCRDPADSCLI